MNLQEVKSQISEIRAAVSSYISEVSELKGNLSKISSRYGRFYKNINDYIDSKAILNYSETTKSKINSSVAGCMDGISNTINTLKSDANKKISELVSAYNARNSLLKPEEQEPYLSAIEFII